MTDQQNAALKPCPFCGDTSPGIDRTVPGFEAVTCLVCGAWIPGETDGTAIAAWNTRPAPAGAEAVREALLQIRETCGKVCEGFETCTHVACQSSYNAWAIADQALRAKAPSTGEGGESVDGYIEDLYQAVKDGVQLHELGVQVEALLAAWCQSKGYTTPTLATPQPAPTPAEDGLREALASAWDDGHYAGYREKELEGVEDAPSNPWRDGND